MLMIHNTRTQTKEQFKPIHAGKVNMYVCGMTVYDYWHIGNARVWVVFDVVARYLRELGYDVNYVRNITDIDDKIIQRARENNESIQDLTQRMIANLHEDERALGILPTTHEPHATEYVKEMIAMIACLVEKGYAYVADNGDVCYNIAQFSNYGELAHQDLEKLRVGARVQVEEGKRDPLDFVLWKLAKPGEPSWSSPWGEGRPGWHIECSAMSLHLLGAPFDIHGGGVDLIFPHHQNEVAQSEAATGKPFVNTWMHVGFVQVNSEKMSKSLGNFFIVRDVLKQYSAEVVRYFLLSSHYRSPLNYSDQTLGNAHQALTRFYTALRDVPVINYDASADTYLPRFHAAMQDDFNTPEALAVMFDVAHALNLAKSAADTTRAAELAGVLRKLGGILGVLQQDPEAFLRGDIEQERKQQIEALITAREVARKNKNWQEADRIRNELIMQGIVLEDGAQGTTWRLVEKA